MEKKLIFLIFLFTSIFCFAQDLSKIPVTRDIYNSDKTNFEEYKAENPFIKAETNLIDSKFNSKNDENVLVIINEELFPLIENSIETYKSDLENENYSYLIYTFTGSEAEDLKDVIIDKYNSNNITGVFFIGDLPSAWYEMEEEFKKEFVNFPIDHFFTDLDGEWIDENSNGVYDDHTGLVRPDIWAGRLKADNLSFIDKTEAEIINSYFERNNKFRNGLMGSNNKALAYIDDDWEYWGTEYQEALQNLYDDTELINEINATNADDYRENRLPVDYNFIQLHCHSGPNAHYMYQNNGNEHIVISNEELVQIVPTSFFYNLFCCSNCHFETDNDMGLLYLFGNDFAQGIVGSTKTGSMLFFEDYYTSLSENNNFGEALRFWWSNNVDTAGGDQGWERSWFYGMVHLGDPTLQAKYDAENVIYVDSDFSGEETGSPANPFNTIQEAINIAENGNYIYANAGTYNETVDFSNKSLKLLGEDYNTTIINPNSNNGITINADNSELKNIQITNAQNALTITSENNLISKIKLTENTQAVLIEDGSADINKSIISENNNSIAATNSEIKLINSFSIDNSTDFSISDNSNLEIIHSTFSGNMNFSNQIISSSLEMNNSIWSDDDTFHIDNNSAANISFSMFKNGSASFEGEGEINYSSDNITGNPSFVENSFDLSKYSKCIGAGNSETNIIEDFYGNIRPNPSNSNPDIGAFEHELANPRLTKLFVSTTGSDSGNGSEENPFATIEYAFDYASESDTIVVKDGTYYENLDLIGKPIAIISENGAENCIIDGSSENVVVKFSNNTNPRLTFSGFTIQNGESGQGGGLSFINGANPRVVKSIIKDNHATNSAGIYINNAKPIIERCTIVNNTAENNYGGLFVYNSSEVIINSIFWNNSPDNFFGEPNIFFSDLEFDLEGEGNIFTNPLFEDESYKLTENSPCIDSGTNFFEFDDEIIISYSDQEYAGDSADMGFYEFNQNSTEQEINPNKITMSNYPNPFYLHKTKQNRTTGTTISFSTNKEYSKADIEIYNILGQKINSLSKELGNSKTHSIHWNGENNQNSKVASGIYFYKLKLDGKVKLTKKCLLIK